MLKSTWEAMYPSQQAAFMQSPLEFLYPLQICWASNMTTLKCHCFLGTAIMEGCPCTTVEEAVASSLTHQASGAALGEGTLPLFG